MVHGRQREKRLAAGYFLSQLINGVSYVPITFDEYSYLAEKVDIQPWPAWMTVRDTKISEQRGQGRALAAND